MLQQGQVFRACRAPRPTGRQAADAPRVDCHRLMNGESAQREQARSCDRTDAAARHASALVGWCKRSSNSRKARLSRDGRPTWN
jgi:hypothetical protein